LIRNVKFKKLLNGAFHLPSAINKHTETRGGIESAGILVLRLLSLYPPIIYEARVLSDKKTLPILLGTNQILLNQGGGDREAKPPQKFCY
jgi:hypothetical protein